MPFVTWREAWNEALYGPDGFFVTARPAQHFRTAVAASDVFAEAIAQMARQENLSTVVDVGAGGGELLARLSVIDPGLTLVGVDLAPRPEHLPGNIDWHRDIPPEFDGLLVAHEWLDNIPCDVVELDDDGDTRLVLVDPATGDERLGDPIDAEWLERHVFSWPAEVVGAVYDRRIAGSEVAAVPPRRKPLPHLKLRSPYRPPRAGKRVGGEASGHLTALAASQRGAWP